MSLRLPSPFGSHMVLQRGRPHVFRGWDEPGVPVGVRARGHGTEARAEAVTGADGRWRLELPELPAGGPYTVEVAGSTGVVLEDVLVGEVWFASGQSNMQWELARAHDAEEAIPHAHHPGLRLFRAECTTAWEPQEDVPGRWERCTPETAAFFSAVAYHFGAEVHAALAVPVGMIASAWGGTRIEAWMSEQALGTVMDVAAERARFPRTPAEQEEAVRDQVRRAHEWEMTHLPADPGNRAESAGWAEPGFDDAGWATMPVPGYWQSHGVEHNGVVWFRRRVRIPAAWAGRALRLRLGRIDDFDHTYFNGEPVGAHPKGTPQAYDLERDYEVPGRFVAAGEAVIAVRVFDHFGQGGFGGPASALSLAPADADEETRALDLAGEWRFAVEHRIPPVPPSVFASFPGLPMQATPQNRPAALFHAMVAPFLGLGIRGALWYQGESNAAQASFYAERLRILGRDWRTRWGLGTFPFLVVQLTSFAGGGLWPILREAQSRQRAEPGVGVAVILDAGDAGDIHPTDKRTVGHRLACLALADTYGLPVAAHGPLVRAVDIAGGEVVVRWRHAEGGLRTTDGAAPRGFELAGPDGHYHPAEAVIEGGAVRVTAAAVPVPVAVRYAFRDAVEVNLVNTDGVPADPFRTDCW